ncbi:DsbA family protein [Deinococcus sedimenti]|uniref:Thioredoxin domain-containing protein n=1 Tax=Deinococcus sedimenti TaxID=1867090 RepID=A0ABQ2SBA6_9DEIO|nr:thioredoxin domain-containing protein [Deinococcus sedimenti]GGS08031.1 hypothetical protein GCM10008960_38050 [Deinococcus sedimenti]
MKRFLGLCTALLLGMAGAQVGRTTSSVLADPAFAGASIGTSGTLTLNDGTRLVLRTRAGYALEATILIPYVTPSAVPTPAQLARQQAAKTRAGELAGAYTGYGQALADAVTGYLNRADIAAKLTDGVQAFAEPYQMSIRAKGGVLTVEVQYTKLNVGLTIPTANALPARSPGKVPFILRIYSDFQCPYCQQFERQTWPTLLANLPADVRVEFHHLPLEQIHPQARAAAEAAECAAQQNKFWEYKDQLFANSSWIQANPNPALIAAALSTGLNGDTFRTCLAEGLGKANVDANIREAAALQLNSTPSIFVNTYRVPNPYDAAAILKLVDFVRATEGTTKP